MASRIFGIALVYLLIQCFAPQVFAYIEALAANIDSNPGHFQPMVGILCGHGKYHNQYLDENKKWISDRDPRATCMKDKLEILEYCRKVYPKRDIRNIVESSKYYRIDSWCKVNGSGKQCKAKHYVKPYRCLEGVFQSDALLVPEHCVFDHIHNQTVCQAPQYWNRTALNNCEARNLKLLSYAMLLPCGVDIFSGVEFVCCPSGGASSSSSTPTIAPAKTPKPATFDNSYWKKVDEPEKEDDKDDKNDDDDYYDDEYDEEDDDQQDEEAVKRVSSTTTTSTTTTTTTTESPVKSYLSKFNFQKEHDSFKDAERALESDHKKKVTKVMKEWSELEEHYQEMRNKDSKSADEFKKRMTNRFQKTVEALEEEGSAEKRQIISMHQQRVMTIINIRKKSAMECYTKALEADPPKTKKIEKCLEKLLRALEKDRMHTLHHFKHLLNSFTKQALKDKEAMLDHLTDLIKMANKSIQMLDSVPAVAERIRHRMTAFWHNLRGVPVEQSITRESELAIMDRYEEEVAQRQLERERQKEADELKRQELKELEEEQQRAEAAKRKQQQQQQQADDDSDSDEEEDDDSQDDSQAQASSQQGPTASSSTVSPPSSSSSSSSNSIDDLLSQEDADNNEIDTHHIPIASKQQPMYLQSGTFHHNEPTFSVKRDHFHNKKWNGSVYITLGFAGIALLTATIVGVVLLRKHTQTSAPHGFIKVNQSMTPEEKDVTNMQVNGYENPTYRFFEEA